MIPPPVAPSEPASPDHVEDVDSTSEKPARLNFRLHCPTIVVSHLVEPDETSLMLHFGQYGEVTGVEFYMRPNDPGDVRTDGILCARVSFDAFESAYAALEAGNKQWVGGTEVVVK